MSSKSLRINPSSSPRGSANRARPGKKEVEKSPAGTKCPKIMTNTTGKPPRGESGSKFRKVSQEQADYIHVHRYKNTTLYGAWFKDPSKAGKKKRLFFGSHLTAYLAARAQDRAALKYKPSALDPSSIKLNFKEEHYAADKKLRRILTNEEFGELLRRESRQKYTKMEPTPCLRKFLKEEEAAGNIPVQSFESGITLEQYLQNLMQKRIAQITPPKTPVQTERSGSKRIARRIGLQEPKWGSKRRRSYAITPCSAPWSNATKMLLADRTETEFVTGSKLQYKLRRLNTKSKTPEASASTTLASVASAPQPIHTYKLHLLASTALEEQERQ